MKLLSYHTGEQDDKGAFSKIIITQSAKNYVCFVRTPCWNMLVVVVVFRNSADLLHSAGLARRANCNAFFLVRNS